MQNKILVIGTMMVLLVVVMRIDWHFSLVSIPFLILPIIFYRRMSYTQLVTFSMFGSILMAYFLLNLFLMYEITFLLQIAILSILAMCIMAVMGIFEDNLKKYLIYSNAIQLTFVLLDLTIAKLSQKITTLGTIQIFNYPVLLPSTRLYLAVLVSSEDGICLCTDISNGLNTGLQSECGFSGLYRNNRYIYHRRS